MRLTAAVTPPSVFFTTTTTLLPQDAMDPSAFAIQLFSGLSRAMVLFLLSAGLSLIFGVMNILNFAHATLWLVGGYLTYSIFEFLGGQFGASPWLLLPAILGATAAMVAAGCALVGTLLVVLRMSLLGDAISHAILPGIVVAVLAARVKPPTVRLTEPKSTTLLAES